MGKEVIDYDGNPARWCYVEIFDPKTCKATGAKLVISKADLGVPTNIVTFQKNLFQGAKPQHSDQNRIKRVMLQKSAPSPMPKPKEAMSDGAEKLLRAWLLSKTAITVSEGKTKKFGVVHYYSDKASIFSIQNSSTLESGKTYALGRQPKDWAANPDAKSFVEIYDPKTLEATGAVLLFQKSDLDAAADLETFLKGAVSGAKAEDPEHRKLERATE